MKYLEIKCMVHFKRLSIDLNGNIKLRTKVETIKLYADDDYLYYKINCDKNWSWLPIVHRDISNDDLQITNSKRLTKFFRLAIYLI